MQNGLFLCVDGVYVKDRKILMLKRNVEPFKGFWHVVGGHVEKNETLEAALKREFKEETNLDVKVKVKLCERLERTFDRTKLIVAFEVASAKGKIKLNSENTEFEWFANVPLKTVFDYTRYLKRST